ncbi:MAG: glycosyltransferase family 4 protein [Flavobacteriales bacterium]
MKFVILTQYFPPETGAPQNRLYELAVRLKKEGATVEILTAMPNYPQMKLYDGYKGKFYRKEVMDGMTVHRGWIYVSKSKSVFKRLLNYYSFVFSSFWIGLFKLKRHDVLICESPPLFLGKTAFLLSRLKRAKLIFNVSDLWPESAEKMGIVKNRFFLWIASRLERFMYKRSWIITGQTQGIVKSISNRFPKKTVHWLPNGVDPLFYNPDREKGSWREDNGFKPNDFILLYAGIIGHAQGLEVIIDAAKRLREYTSIKFVLVGNGPQKEELLKLRKEAGVEQVYFFDSVPKDKMPDLVSAADVAIIPLRKLDLFKGAIPSKIFESLAMKKPILLGVDGEARDLFITEGNCGLYVEPENAVELANAVLKLADSPQLIKQLGENGRKYVEAKFSRDKIAHEFHQFIKQRHPSFSHKE